jgi:hypothetical protein
MLGAEAAAAEVAAEVPRLLYTEPWTSVLLDTGSLAS